MGLLAVAGKKIGTARPHVARHMFHDDRDGIRFRVQDGEESLIRTLGHRAIAKLLVVTKEVDGIFQVRRGEVVCHNDIFYRYQHLSTQVFIFEALINIHSSKVTDSALPASKQSRS